nr:tRNA (adenosine(37)-N6)-dimethylallyltransferase MiaA [Lachnospiraceae bacterium]
YRGMNIGTDKISPGDMHGIRHHLIDILDPDEEFNVYRFKDAACRAIEEIRSRGKLPMIVGGTGFYIQSVLYDIDFSEENDGGAYRASLEEQVRTRGEAAVKRLHEELAKADPEAAAQIHENNVKRVIRALEYHHMTGGLISEHNREQREKESAYNSLYFVLTDDRARLYERIDRRVDMMIAEGLESEVRSLLDEGMTGDEMSMLGLGYRQMVMHIRDGIPLERAVELIKRDTRHFAKRQLTWFKREKDVIFIDRREFPSDEDALDEIMRIAGEKWK